MKDRISVLLVDDHDVILTGLETVISKQPDMYVMERLSSGRRLLETVESRRPDVVLLDLMMEDFDFYRVLEDFKEIQVETRIIIVSSLIEPYIVVRGEELGLSGYLSKEDALGDLLPSFIRSSMEGAFVVSSKAREFRDDARIRQYNSEIPQAQYEVLCLLREGNDPLAIADKLGKDREAVYSLLKRARARFGVSNNIELVKKVTDKGIVPK